MKIIYIFLVLLCFLGFKRNSFSQIEYKPGFIIENNGDTVYGKISYGSNLSLSKKCIIKNEAGTKYYSPDEIAGFRIIDEKFFVSKDISNVDNSKSFVFMEFLIQGEINIYCYRDKKGDHYYIETKRVPLTEITSKGFDSIKDKHKQYLVKNNYHKNILRALLSDTPELYPQIENVHANHKSLIKLGKEYHNMICDEYECIVYSSKSYKNKFSIDIIGSYGYAKLSMDDINYKRAYPINLSTNLDVFSFGFRSLLNIPQINKNLYLVSDLLMSFESGNSSREINLRYNYRYKSINSVLSIGVTYIFPLKKIQPYFLFACNGYYNIKREIEGEISRNTEHIRITDNNLNFRDFTYGFNVGVGIKRKLKNKRLLSCQTSFSRACDTYKFNNSYTSYLKLTILYTLKK